MKKVKNSGLHALEAGKKSRINGVVLLAVTKITYKLFDSLFVVYFGLETGKMAKNGARE